VLHGGSLAQIQKDQQERDRERLASKLTLGQKERIHAVRARATAAAPRFAAG
jgi:hypothetical protein